MKFPPLFTLVAALSLVFGAGPVSALTADEVNKATMARDLRKKTNKPAPSIVKAQVLLSRRGISPGLIDGLDGENYRKAIAQFRRQEMLGDADTMDARTWQALGGDATGDIVVEYKISAKDSAHRFAKRIPRDYARQARLKRLAYTSAREMLAERFHMSERLLLVLNPRTSLRKAGGSIFVIAATRATPPGSALRVEAVKSTGMVVIYGEGDRILASYPATIGSGETPSPEGEYQIERVVRNPTYHYDPDKNFQQGNNTRKLVLPAGPNNPVGTVWIALSKPTFGIHGTPDPSRVSKNSSHGCVRLTNWDAEHLAAMVKPGVFVRFVD
ncbi:L,D-transpeptidase family protein [Bosea sp. LjRoot237]|uniref:L,D-transpeptidase family protein n=1 Tax=Bosea sp. LjRoot237 TaxID=3342292 RepID=UPI003ECF88F2